MISDDRGQSLLNSEVGILRLRILECGLWIEWKDYQLGIERA